MLALVLVWDSRPAHCHKARLLGQDGVPGNYAGSLSTFVASLLPSVMVQLETYDSDVILPKRKTLGGDTHPPSFCRDCVSLDFVSVTLKTIMNDCEEICQKGKLLS